jgi:hypothetical protein
MVKRTTKTAGRKAATKVAQGAHEENCDNDRIEVEED